MKINLFDNTRITSHRSCPRRFYFRHIRHISSDGISPPLAFGQAWHSAMDVVWKLASTTTYEPSEIYQMAAIEFKDVLDKEIGRPFEYLDPETEERFKKKNRTPAVAQKMLASYCAKRVPQIRRNFKLVEVEKPFIVPTSIDNVLYVGRMDKVVRWLSSDGKLWAIEHKTTSDGSGKSGFYTSWSEQWNPNSQVEGYAFTGRMLWKDFSGVILDGTLVNNASQHEALITVDPVDDVLEAWLFDLEEEVTRILFYLERLGNQPGNTKTMQAFPRHTISCMDYKQPCMYKNICMSTGNPHRMTDDQMLMTNPNFMIKKWSPFDELKLASLGLVDTEEE